MACFSEARDDDHRDASAIAEEIYWLNVTGVVVASAFVERDENSGVLPEGGIGLYSVDDLLDEAFVQVEF